MAGMPGRTPPLPVILSAAKDLPRTEPSPCHPERNEGSAPGRVTPVGSRESRFFVASSPE